MSQEQSDGTGNMDEWSDNEFRLFDNMDLPESAYEDPFVTLMYDLALFSPDADYEMHVLARQTLVDILRDEYDFDFDAAFDWDEYVLAGESGA